MGKDHRGLVTISKRFDMFERRNYLREFVPFDLQDAPTKSFEDSLQVNPRPGILPISTVFLVDRKNPTKLLQSIIVQDRGQISQFVSWSDIQRLPDHSLLEFAISDHDERMIFLSPHSSSERHAQSNGQALAKGASRSVQAR
jgi:hypothetical protein